MQDLENTVGSWDMYGVEESKRYPGLQAEFFERAAAPLTRRESIVSFIATGPLLLGQRAAFLFLVRLWLACAQTNDRRAEIRLHVAQLARLLF